MKKLVITFLALVTLVNFSACGKPSDPTGISLEEFKQIDTGMEFDEVEEIIGGEGTIISEEKINCDDYTDYVRVYKFEGENSGYAEIEFTHRVKKELFAGFGDNEVTAKTQYDLS